MNSFRTLVVAAGVLAAACAYADDHAASAAQAKSADGKAAACCTKNASCCSTDAACCAKDATACCEDDKCEVLTSYVPLSEALAADDLAKAKTAAAALAKQADADGLTKLVDAAQAVAKADSLAAARTAFKAVSLQVTPLAESMKGYIVMNCPMAKADWVQTDDKVRNPYYGKMMLTCGAPKKGADAK